MRVMDMYKCITIFQERAPHTINSTRQFHTLQSIFISTAISHHASKMSDHLSKYDIRNVKELTDSSKWEDFERSSRPWILAGNLDQEAPDVVTDDEDSEKVLKSWERKQLLGCSQLSTRLTKVGAEYVKDVVTITKFMAKLKEKYEEKQEGTFGESYSNFTSLSLSECKSVSDYNNNNCHRQDYRKDHHSHQYCSSSSTPTWSNMNSTPKEGQWHLWMTTAHGSQDHQLRQTKREFRPSSTKQ